MLKVTSWRPAGTPGDHPNDYVQLPHDLRHLRRKLLHLQNDEMVMLDLKEAVLFHHGDILVAENGDLIEVRAADEKLFEVTAKSPLHLIELAWHLGNRHLPAQINESSILIQRDHVIRAMLEGLGAVVRDVDAAFQPVRGAYHAHSGQTQAHAHSHASAPAHVHGPNCNHDHSHDHSHAHSHAHADEHKHEHKHARGDDHHHHEHGPSCGCGGKH
jgi:urease accessory protein